ncbi:MAG: hypothetical protein IJ408_05520 [Clostridia bacterium]|nr:hypothetical protein [Clostridia bacterium]
MTYVFTLGVIITTIILASRISDFIGKEKSRTVIDLTSKDSLVQLSNNETSPAPEQAAPLAQPESAQSTSQNGSLKAGFEASDAQGVWKQEQQVEIFKVKYDETGNITVDGVDDKVIAPGTSNIYNFTFKNTGDVGLKYTFTSAVEFSDKEHALPVSVRLYDQNDKYVIGSKTSFDDADKLNSVSENAELSPKSYSNYALEWQWPFESGDDAYDTLLGNLAVKEDITMTVKLMVRAEADADASGGNPYTGDNSDITINVIVCMVSLAAIVLLVIIDKKRKKRTAENE